MNSMDGSGQLTHNGRCSTSRRYRPSHATPKPIPFSSSDIDRRPSYPLTSIRYFSTLSPLDQIPTLYRTARPSRTLYRRIHSPFPTRFPNSEPQLTIPMHPLPNHNILLLVLHPLQARRQGSDLSFHGGDGTGIFDVEDAVNVETIISRM